MADIKCDLCGLEPKALGDRLPSKWKRWESGVMCPGCVKTGFTLSAIELPIAEPLGWSPDLCLAGEWLPLVWSFGDRQRVAQELARAIDPWIAQCWRRATDLSNWGVIQLLKLDTVPLGATSLPRAPKINLYTEYNRCEDRNRVCWDGGASSMSCTLRAVEQHWNSYRREILWDRSRSAPTYLYPQPIRIHNQQYCCSVGDGGELLATIRLPGVGVAPLDKTSGGWVRLRLAGGHEWRRQRERFLQIVAGRSEQGEAAILRKRVAPSSSNRHTHSDHTCPGGGRGHYRTFVKIVGYFRRPIYIPCPRELVVVTQPDCMWIATIDGRQVWQENGDHIKRQIAAHADYRHRTSQELKFERRHNVDRDRIAASQSERCRKHQNRLKSFMEMSSAAIVGLAQRRRCHLIRYTDTDRPAVRSFPWRGFRALLQRKALAASLQFQGHFLGDEEAANG